MVSVELLHFAFCFIFHLIFISLKSAQEDANSKNFCCLNSQAAKCEFFHIGLHLCSFDREGVTAGSWQCQAGTLQYPNLKFYEEIDFDTIERFKSNHRKNLEARFGSIYLKTGLRNSAVVLILL